MAVTKAKEMNKCPMDKMIEWIHNNIIIYKRKKIKGLDAIIHARARIYFKSVKINKFGHGHGQGHNFSAERNAICYNCSLIIKNREVCECFLGFYFVCSLF